MTANAAKNTAVSSSTLNISSKLSTLLLKIVPEHRFVLHVLLNSTSAGNMWLHGMLQWHQRLMPISCHFSDCKPMLVMIHNWSSVHKWLNVSRLSHLSFSNVSMRHTEPKWSNAAFRSSIWMGQTMSTNQTAQMDLIERYKTSSSWITEAQARVLICQNPSWEMSHHSGGCRRETVHTTQ